MVSDSGLDDGGKLGSPEQYHETNTEPVAGVAVKVTWVPCSNIPAHDPAVQLVGPALEVIVPLPLPCKFSVNVGA